MKRKRGHGRTLGWIAVAWAIGVLVWTVATHGSHGRAAPAANEGAAVFFAVVLLIVGIFYGIKG